MWKQFTKDGFLQYPNFLEIVVQIIPMYRLRAIGGTLYLSGTFLMAFNLWRTARNGKFAPDTEVQAASFRTEPSGVEARHPWGHRGLEGKPMPLTGLALVAVLIGGMIEIIPMFVIKENVPTISSVKPYTPLELLGPRYLHPRRLPGLPFANDPPLPLRDRALWRILQGRRICL